MTANHALPMSQKQADALRREWALLLKMGYASQWTPAQKMARQEEIATLLLQAGQALPRGMTRQELLASVPIRNAEGGRYYVDLADIPQPWRDEFWAALHGSGRPIVEGGRTCCLRLGLGGLGVRPGVRRSSRDADTSPACRISGAVSSCRDAHSSHQA